VSKPAAGESATGAQGRHGLKAVMYADEGLELFGLGEERGCSKKTFVRIGNPARVKHSGSRDVFAVPMVCGGRGPIMIPFI